MDALEEWNPLLNTITADNEKAFSKHQRIPDILNIDFFLAKPDHSWQRRTSETLRGRIGQLSKKTDFSSVDQINGIRA